MLSKRKPKLLSKFPSNIDNPKSKLSKLSAYNPKITILIRSIKLKQTLLKRKK
jgi:hypothetical protein